jgi:hypothetical protein
VILEGLCVRHAYDLRTIVNRDLRPRDYSPDVRRGAAVGFAADFVGQGVRIDDDRALMLGAFKAMTGVWESGHLLLLSR